MDHLTAAVVQRLVVCGAQDPQVRMDGADQEPIGALRVVVQGPALMPGAVAHCQALIR